MNRDKPSKLYTCDANRDGTIVGNVYDKYHTRNPIARWLMSRFLRSIAVLVRKLSPTSILEVGCGEGWLADYLVRHVWRPERFVAIDLNSDRLADDLDPLIEFRPASAYRLPFQTGEFDLVLCCEVMEHLEYPERALTELARVTSNAVILSTPREPLWRCLNMARGKYLGQLGNTPGHIQHFSQTSLRSLVARHLTVQSIASPVPWTVMLAVKPAEATD